ncbi:MAG: DUF4268 domain-containing protein [Planctomycetia bacterium]|nr:DUF4268 domain-containing protein [Planctomycetia bacterium]
MWPHEAGNFTPWLAHPDNIQRLGEAIGLELEVEHTEVAVGPFAADILARETASGTYVVENQLNRTDHDHLGKSLTYAAALGAKTVVWVATEFTDEHRKTLDWLNDNSVEDLSFFGVQVELWAIDESKPAVRFNVVSRPTELLRPAKVAANAELSPTRRLQLEWWTAFRDALLAAKALPSAQSPRAQYWYNVAESRAEIEQAVGEPLTWNPNPEASDKVILLHRKADIRVKDQWPDHLKWMVDAVVRLRKVFAPRIKALQLDAISDGSEVV